MFSFFPKDDHKQTLRIKRFLMAFAAYSIWYCIAFFTFLMGLTLIQLYVLVCCFLGIFVCNILIYAMIRTGFNKRFKDPSLTLLQMMIATFWTMVVFYYAASARSIVLLLYLVIFVFGLFRLNVLEFLFLSLVALVAYATGISLLYQNHPESINWKIDLLNLLVLAMVLPWFSLIGGYITKLRTKIAKALFNIKETELKFRTIFDFASDGIILLNVGEGKFSDANEKICNMLGYTKEELLKLSIHNIHPQESIAFITNQYEKLLKKEILTAKNIPVIKKDKTVFFADISGSSITLGEKEYSIGMFRDISERKQADEALKKSEQIYLELSIIDDLTQLYNSRHFYAQLEREIERSNRYGQPLTILLMDLDKFKEFNDTYGHIEGDYVLSRLGQVVKRCLREIDSAYRYGGEEFTIMLPMTTSEDGLETAKRIQAELRKEAFSPVLGQEVYITVSMGISQYKPKEEMKSFVNRVDQLMYQAKKNGRDRICPES